MKNKNVGFLIIGIGIVLAALVSIFDYSIRNIISATCSHGPSCPMYASLSIQTWISLAIVALIIIIGIFLIFSKEQEKIIIKKLAEKKKSIDLSKLDKDEKQVVKILQNENGAIFQSSLMEKLGIGKVGITRLLDKLEAKQIIERKRRGMNNIVILK
jgi:uncharacterized membrane protein